MKKVVFSGCSITAGMGWDCNDPCENNPDYPDLWVNLCHKNIQKLNQLELVNIGISGASNTDIFTRTVEFMSQHQAEIDTLFVQWTSGPRYRFNPGFELWSTNLYMIKSRVKSMDVNLSNGINWSADYVSNLLDRLIVLHHLHWEVLKIVKYQNIIKNIGKSLGIDHIFFINGLCPWDENFFIKLDNVLPEEYTPFTKDQILEIKNRNDEDILKLYNLAHQQYQEAGGVDPNNWLNLYNSFLNNRIDYNFDNIHPGTKSNQLYFEIVKSGLENLGYI